MIYSTFFLPKMQELDLHDMWFQQDGAKCHTARVTRDLLRGKFGENFISRSVPANWPPRSCDLTNLDYFLWGYVKAHVYTDKSASIDPLIETTFKYLFVRYRPKYWKEYEKIGLSGWTSRAQHLHEIIFKH